MEQQHTNTTVFKDARVLTFAAVAALLGAGFAMAWGVEAATTTETNTERPTMERLYGRNGGCADTDRVERHAAVRAALEAGDFDAWQEAMGERGPVKLITEENFDEFVEMHEALEAGDSARADALRAELGLPERPQHSMHGAGRGMGHGMWRTGVSQ